MHNNQYQVELTQKSQTDLRDIAAYHKFQVGPISAARITDKLLDKIEMLGSFPDMGTNVPARRIRDAGFQMLIVDEYICFYRKEAERVIIYHIVHGSTNYIKNLF